MDIVRHGSTFEEQQECEFRLMQEQVEEMSYYGNSERLTIDKEWTESELKDDIYDEAVKFLTEDMVAKYKGRALEDVNLLLPAYLANKVYEDNDIVVVYNKAVTKHRHDSDKKFGIVYFDEALKEIFVKMLKDNLISR